MKFERDGQGEPLFVLHGGPGLGYAYLHRSFVDHFASNFELWFYDQRGSGDSMGSDQPELLTIDHFVLDLEAMRIHSGHERIAITGHSFGGLLAQHYAIRFPERVRCLLLVDSDPATYQQWSRFAGIVAARTRKEDAAEIRKLQAVGGVEAMQRLLAIQLRPYFANPEAAGRLSIELDEHRLRNLITTPVHVRRSLGAWDLRGALTSLRIPALIIAGGQSIFPPEAPQTLADCLQGSELVVLPDAGHFPHEESPEAFRAAALPFLNRYAKP